MKKILSLVLVIVLVFSTFSFNVFSVSEDEIYETEIYKKYYELGSRLYDYQETDFYNEEDWNEFNVLLYEGMEAEYNSYDAQTLDDAIKCLEEGYDLFCQADEVDRVPADYSMLEKVLFSLYEVDGRDVTADDIKDTYSGEESDNCKILVSDYIDREGNYSDFWIDFAVGHEEWITFVPGFYTTAAKIYKGLRVDNKAYAISTCRKATADLVETLYDMLGYGISPENGMDIKYENFFCNIKLGHKSLDLSGDSTDDYELSKLPFWNIFKDDIWFLRSDVKYLGDYALAYMTQLNDLNIQKLESTGDYSFYNCDSIEYFNSPSTLKVIGKYAFADCDSMRYFATTEAIESIDEGAFLNCYALSEFTVPEKITTIEKDTFKNCSSLKRLIIQENVETIKDAFDGCQNLTTIYYTGSENDWNNISMDTDLSNVDIVFDYDGSVIANNYGNLNWSLDKSGKLTITGEGRMTHLDRYFPWYELCESITSVEIGEGITSIGDDAFVGCENLTTVTLPSTLSVIGWDPFCTCPLETITVSEQNPVMVMKNGCLVNTETKTLEAATINSTIPEDMGIEVIGMYAFCWVDYGEKDIVIPDTVKTIEMCAFANCLNAETVFIPASVEKIGDSAFAGSKNIQKIVVEDENKKYKGKNCIIDIAEKRLLLATENVIIPGDGSVEGLDYASFDTCGKMKTLFIPKAVLWTGDCATEECISLTDIYYEGTEEEWENFSYSRGNLPLSNATVHFNSSLVPGDTDNDGVVTDDDVSDMKDYFAGKDALINRAAGDANNDGVFTRLDLLRMCKENTK